MTAPMGPEEGVTEAMAGVSTVKTPAAAETDAPSCRTSSVSAYSPLARPGTDADTCASFHTVTGAVLAPKRRAVSGGVQLRKLKPRMTSGWPMGPEERSTEPTKGPEATKTVREETADSLPAASSAEK
jgi:hypothetical protein